MSEDPVSWIGAIAAAASAVSGIVSATSKPDTPEAPKAIPNAGLMQADRRRQAAAQGRSSTALTSQKLGNVGGNIG